MNGVNIGGVAIGIVGLTAAAAANLAAGDTGAAATYTGQLGAFVTDLRTTDPRVRDGSLSGLRDEDQRWADLQVNNMFIAAVVTRVDLEFSGKTKIEPKNLFDLVVASVNFQGNRLAATIAVGYMDVLKGETMRTQSGPAWMVDYTSSGSREYKQMVDDKFMWLLQQAEIDAEFWDFRQSDPSGSICSGFISTLGCAGDFGSGVAKATEAQAAFYTLHAATGNASYDSIAGLIKLALNPKAAKLLEAAGKYATLTEAVIAGLSQANRERNEPYLPTWKFAARFVTTTGFNYAGAAAGAFIATVLAEATPCAMLGPWGYAACVGGLAVAGGIGGAYIGQKTADQINNSVFQFDKSRPVAFGENPYNVSRTDCSSPFYVPNFPSPMLQRGCRS
jgi:hypothetical protein